MSFFGPREWMNFPKTSHFPPVMIKFCTKVNSWNQMHDGDLITCSVAERPDRMSSCACFEFLSNQSLTRQGLTSDWSRAPPSGELYYNTTPPRRGRINDTRINSLLNIVSYPLRGERQPHALQLTRRVVEGERMLFGLGDDEVELDLFSQQQVREREGVQRWLAHLWQRRDRTRRCFY